MTDTSETMKTWTRADDKAGLPPGPWQDEPDKAVWVDEATGLDCMVNRNHMGAWCGYVGVGPDHPLHGKGYDDADAEVHGGLTYAAGCQESVDESEGVCHVPEPGRPHDVWWFGFDCGHYQDLVPTMRATLEAAGITDSLNSRDVYRDFDYVKTEVESLAKQLAT